ncbi:hypothetical protein LJR030_002716 [Rhizobium sp. LjRoot30]|uniref:hypothetical protein n=1 Tax=Rhizobium sp. LjRoot30 TaxID=3342320 RepID=UPI003ECDA213
MRSAIRIAGLVAGAVSMALTSTGSFAAEGGARWGARDPVTVCREITTAAPPAEEDIANLVRCEKETITASDELWLVDDLSVQIGASRPHLGVNELLTMPDSDTAKEVYPIRGSWTWAVCRDPQALTISGEDPTKNCTRTPIARAEGACWMTTFGSWRCNMTGPTGAAEKGFAPPQ